VVEQIVAAQATAALEHADKDAEIASMNAQCVELAELIRQCEGARMEADRKVEEEAGQCDALRAELAALTEQHALAMVQVQEENENEAAASRGLQDEVHVLQLANDELQEENEQLKGQLEVQVSITAARTEQLEEANRRLACELQEKLEDAATHADALREADLKAHQQAEQCTALRAELAARDEQLQEAIRRHASELQDQLGDATARGVAAAAQCTALRAELAARQQAIEQLQEQVGRGAASREGESDLQLQIKQLQELTMDQLREEFKLAGIAREQESEPQATASLQRA
jgi:hypothetical protein